MDNQLYAGVRVGDRDGCHAVAAASVGLNSGTFGIQKRDENGNIVRPEARKWWRPEHGLMSTLICGPVAVGGTLSRIDTSDGESREHMAVDKLSGAVMIFGSDRFGAGVSLSARSKGSRTYLNCNI